MLVLHTIHTVVFIGLHQHVYAVQHSNHIVLGTQCCCFANKTCDVFMSLAEPDVDGPRQRGSDYTVMCDSDRSTMSRQNHLPGAPSTQVAMGHLDKENQALKSNQPNLKEKPRASYTATSRIRRVMC